MSNIIMADVPSSGPKVFTGTIELTNTKVDALTIPVDVSDAQKFEVVAYVDRTGKVENGVVTYDTNPTVPSVFSGSSNAFVWYIAATELHSEKNIYRDTNGNLSSFTRPHNVSYLIIYYGNNGATYSVTSNPVSGTSIKLISLNANRHFCQTGVYVRFVYTVTKM